MSLLNTVWPAAGRPLAKTMTLTSLLVVLGSTLVNLSAAAQSRGTLTVEVSGLRDLVGQLCVNIFAAGQSFPEGSGVPGQGKCVPITANSIAVQFENLAYGNYAVAAYHDRNQDNQLNQGAFGIPLEGFGFSRNPSIGFGPPSFESAQISHGAAQTKTVLQLRYLQ